MSKEEILKIQTWVLKVNIHCDGCEQKVRKILQKIDGVYKTSINSEEGKVTVSGNVDPTTLIKKLGKSGKHAELWGTSKPNQNNNNSNSNNNNSNLKTDSAKVAIKNQKGNNGNKNNNLQKGGHDEELKVPQFKGLKLPFTKDQNKKVTFEDAGMNGDRNDDDVFNSDDYVDAVASQPIVKGKTGMGSAQMPNKMGSVMSGQAKGGNNGGNGKKGGGGNVPVKANDGTNGNGKKGAGGGNVAQNQGNSCGKGIGGKSGGGENNSKDNNSDNGNGGKKMGSGMNDGIQRMPAMSNGNHPGMGGGNLGQLSNMPMGKMSNFPMSQMGNFPMGQMGNFPMGQMGQIPTVQGLPTTPMGVVGNSYYQQQVMNQQHAQGNESFQPMMYARPPPAVNYMPPYYPYPPPADPFTHVFSDENTSSCSVM